MNTRIDVISGTCGTEKTELIRRLLDSGSYPADRAVACCGYEGGREMSEAVARIVGQCHPSRLLLETPESMLFEEVPTALGALMSQAYIGTRALMVDAQAIIGGIVPSREYYERQLNHAHVVFVNRTEGFTTVKTLDVLRFIWTVNRHVNLMIEPLSGIDLWMVFDLCVN